MYLFLFFMYFGCSSQTSTIESVQEQSLPANTRSNDTIPVTQDQMNPIKNISVPELYQLYSSNQDEAPIIIDVRTTAEYENVHIPTAIHIPLQDLSNRSQDIETYLKGRDKEIYLVCAVGGRSAQGADILSQKGFKKVINVMGGTNGWVALGFPTEKGSQKTTDTETIPSSH